MELISMNYVHLDIMSNIQNFTLMIQMLMQKNLIVSRIFYYIHILKYILFVLGIQRGHQHTLEVYPEFLLMLGLGSIKYPLISSIGGVIWLLGRIVFFKVCFTY